MDEIAGIQAATKVTSKPQASIEATAPTDGVQSALDLNLDAKLDEAHHAFALMMEIGSKIEATYNQLKSE